MKTKRVFHKENIINFHKKIEERKVNKMDAELGEYCDTCVKRKTYDGIDILFFNFYRIIAES